MPSPFFNVEILRLIIRGKELQKGFNTDISLQGQNYHVQTEDWGFENPYLVSRVFSDGAVLKSLKIAYTEILPEAHIKSEQAVRLAMKIQHDKILDLLVSGHLI